MQRAKLFRFMERVENSYNEARYGTKPRPLQDDDYDDWNDAASATIPTLQTREQVAEALRRMNPVKWRQIQGDVRWMKRRMQKLGLNPEDFRYIL